MELNGPARFCSWLPMSLSLSLKPGSVLQGEGRAWRAFCRRSFFLLNLLWLLHSGLEVHGCLFFNNFYKQWRWCEVTCSVIAEFQFFVFKFPMVPKLSGSLKTWLWFYLLQKNTKKQTRKKTMENDLKKTVESWSIWMGWRKFAKLWPYWHVIFLFFFVSRKKE